MEFLQGGLTSVGGCAGSDGALLPPSRGKQLPFLGISFAFFARGTACSCAYIERREGIFGIVVGDRSRSSIKFYKRF